MAVLKIKNSSGNWENITVLKGDIGITPSISIKTTTLDPNSSATVTKSGTDIAPVFTIGIPKGERGDGKVNSVNGVEPDTSGNINITSVPKATQDASGNIITDTYATKESLKTKVDDFTISLFNGTAGNPKAIKFATINYSDCDANNGVAAKISLMSGHGNGVSYLFSEDVILKVGYPDSTATTVKVSADIYKYYGVNIVDEGVARQYGDVFWVEDSENKLIDFYCLLGQYSYLYQTPWKRVTYSTKGSVTQYTQNNVYSTGTKVWGNNCQFALTSANTLTVGAVNVTSDIRKKSNLVSIDDVTSKLDTINAYSYDLEGDSSGRRIGVIAQDVLKVFPEAIRETPEGYLTVDYQALTAISILAIKELKQEIKFLKEKINQ